MAEHDQNNFPLNIATQQDDSGKLPKARSDVEITEQVYYGKPCYVLKDPTTLRYYRLRPPEYAIYKMLDGKVGMEDVLKVLSERFPSDEYDSQAVMSFIIMLRGATLLRIPGKDDTDYLMKRKAMMTRSFFQRIRTEFLFFKMPLIDPDKLLNYLHSRLGGWLFTRTASVLSWVMLAGAVILLFSNIENLGQRQPLLSWINLLYLGPAIFIIKIVHEFGHALTSKHFDTEVHEMGILFLVFMPCMYCDVSDAWTLSEKRKRMWITAAGIVVEILLAGVATYIWALTQPGTVINQFALNFMLAASINTILFNGNPLLRFDGYYFLMDLMEIPNLKQKGSAYLQYLAQRFVLGMESAQEPIDVRGREISVISYAICSTIYRWFIMVAIVTMVWQFLDPYGWGVIGGVMALGCIYTSFIGPFIKFIKFISARRLQMKIHAVTATIMVVFICGVFFLVLLLPVEQSIDAQCVLRPAEVYPLYVTQAGFIKGGDKADFIRDGQKVSAGQVLLVLSEPQLEHEVKGLSLQIEQKKIERSQARQQRMPALESQIDAQVKGLEAQYDRAKSYLDQLTISSPIDGVVQLRTNEPLTNLVGNYLALQTELMAVYKPGRFEAVVAVKHSDIEFVEPGQEVQIRLWALDSETLISKVVVKPPAPALKMSSPAFSTAFHGEVPTLPGADPESALEPAENTYELVVPIEGQDMRLRDGVVGRAKIIIEERTLAGSFYLWLIRTLRQDIRL